MITFSESFKILLNNCDCLASELLLCESNFNAESPDYITFREKQGLISFMPFGKNQTFNEDGTWKRDNRQSCKPGKLLKLVLSSEVYNGLKNKDIENFTNCFKSYEKSNEVIFEIVSISDAYDSSNYSELPDSCMWDKGYTDFYPNGCTALVAKSETGFIGRALLWDCSILHGESIKLMDRIYAKDDIKELFKQYAKDNGYYHKLRQSYDSKNDFVSPNGDVIYMNVYIQHDNQDSFEDCYPYLDTFAYGDGKMLYNIECEDCRKYTCTDGDREYNDHEGEICLHNGEWISEDDAVEIDGEWYDIDDCVTCHRTDEWILLDDSYRIEISRNETIYIHKRFVHEN